MKRCIYDNCYATSSGGRSVGIVRSRTKGHGVCFFFLLRHFCPHMRRRGYPTPLPPYTKQLGVLSFLGKGVRPGITINNHKIFAEWKQPLVLSAEGRKVGASLPLASHS
jgi:hypothetical protein